MVCDPGIPKDLPHQRRVGIALFLEVSQMRAQFFERETADRSDRNWATVRVPDVGCTLYVL